VIQAGPQSASSAFLSALQLEMERLIAEVEVLLASTPHANAQVGD
jgi:hypothetical protein